MAGAQDEVETETWKNKGGEPQQQQNNQENSSSSSFLWRGLRFGKRFAIAGAAIVAVPAVIPTIVFGVAFAFPFGVYMAGFALTDRVMRSLLSTSSSEIGILEDGKEKGGVLKREAGAEEGVEDERDEYTPLTAEQMIDIWPPTTNLNILPEEGDDVSGTGIGKEKHAEEKDEPRPLTAEQKIDMWSGASNLNILAEEEDDGSGTGIGEERHAEEKDELQPLTAEQKIDMWSRTTNLNILEEEEDDGGGTGIGEERHAEEKDELQPLTAEQKIDMWSRTTNLNILAEEEDDGGGTGIGEERHAEERDEPTPLATEPKIDMWPPTTYSSIIIEEGDDFGGSGIGEERHVEERDGPTPLPAEEKIDMWSPTSNLNILSAKGDDFSGTGIGEESHAEELTDRELEACDPGQETEIKFKHASSIDEQEYIIGDTGMKKEVEENEERRERENDKHNTNEELKIWSSETSCNGNDYVERGFVNMKGGEKPFEVIGEGEKKKTKDEMEIQDLASVPERDESAPLTAEQKVDIRPPATNLNIPTEEGDDVGGTGIGEEKHAEEEEDDGGGTGIGEERHAEELQRDEPTPLATEQKIDMWPPTTYSSIIIEEGDDFGGSGIGKERHAEERDGPTPVTAEKKIDMWSPISNLNILTAKGDDFGGTGIGEESHAEGLTDGELEICDPGHETEIKFGHASSIDDKEYIIGDTGMKKEVQKLQSEREVEENEESRKRENDKHNTNEEPKIWSLETSSYGNDYVERGFANMKGGDKPFEVIGKGEKKKPKDELENQGLAAVPEVKQYHMVSYPSIEAMPIGTNSETDQTMLSSECSAPIEKRNRTRIEEVQQPEMFLERRSGGTEDMVQDAEEVRVNKKDGIEPIQSSYVLESAVEPSPEENKYEEGVETIGLTAESRMAKEQVLSANYTEDDISGPVPKVEGSSICPSFVSASPLERENQMAPLNLSKEYASPIRDHSSDVTDVESGSAHTVVETAGVLHFNDERDESTPLTAEQKIDIWPPATNLNILTEEGDDVGGTGIGKEQHAEEKDEPPPLTAEQKIDMWSRTPNLNILTEEEDDGSGTGIGEERHAEERDEPTPLPTEHKIDMWPPTTDSSIIIDEGDEFGGSGIGEERHAEERDGPTPVTAEEKIDMWSATTILNILAAKGDVFGGTGIGEESHAEGLAGGELEVCDPGQETEFNFKHASSIDDEECIIGDTGMKKEVHNLQPEREVEENEDRRKIENDKHRRKRETDKHNTNEGLKIWSSETSSNGNDYVERGFVNMKGGDKPFEVIGKGEKQKIKDEMEIQGLAAPPEVKQYHMASYPSIEAMPIGTNNVTDQTMLSSECSASIEKRNRTRIEEMQQPEKFSERRSGGTEDMGQDAEELRVNKKDGIEPIQSSFVLESAVESSFEEHRREEGVETIGLTSASRMANDQVLSANYTEDSISGPVPKVVEDSSICPSYVSAAPLECENQMAPVNLSEKYVSPIRDNPSDVAEVENGTVHTVVETAGVLHFNDEVPNGQDEVEREKHPLVQNDIDTSPLTINRNMPSEEGRELYNSDAEQDTKMKFESAASIGYDDATAYLGMVQKESEIHAESGPEKSEHRGETEKMDIVIESSGDDTVDKKNAEEEMEIQGSTAAVPEARCHQKTTPFAAVMPDNDTEPRVLNESRMQEVKQSDTTLDGRAGRAKDETLELFPTIHYSLDVVPEEREIEFELPGMSSENACSAVTNKKVEEKTVKEANEEKVVGQAGMEPKQRNYAIASVGQNLNDQNAEDDGGSDVTYSIEEASVHHPFVAAITSESETEMAPSSSSTEFASAAEDQSSCMTDAESGPSVTVVEAPYSEDSMWEQIYALRTIVGHKAALHSSLVEELKALYLVTGVEPPISLNDTSDILEISDKLKFLKSVVGVE